MSELSNTSLIASWNNAADQINRYFTIFNLLFGIVGNILNIVVLSQRSLRTNPCSWIFLVSSIFSLTAIICGLTTRVLDGWGADFTATNNLLCKMRAFFVFSSKTSVMWLIVLATIDRWLLSSINANLRKKSTLKNAQIYTILIAVCSTVLYSQLFYCYQAQIVTAPLRCYCVTVWCRYVTDLTLALITNLFPLTLMILFGCMTIWNVRENRNYMMQFVTAIGIISEKKRTSTIRIIRPPYGLKKTDTQLLTMLIVQITVLTLCVMPHAIHRLYLTFTTANEKSLLQEAVEKFVFDLVVQLCYTGDGMTFYIYTLSGHIFRQELLNLVRTASQKVMPKRR
jgi:hypothetical protein